MKNKLFQGIFTTAMTVFVLCFISFVAVLYYQLDLQYKNELNEQATYLAAMIETEGTDFLSQSVFLDPTRSHISLITPPDRSELSVGGENALTKKETEAVLAAWQNGKQTVKTDLFSFHALVTLKDGRLLVVSGERSPLLVLVVEMLLPFMLVLFAAIFLSLFLASRISTEITAPIVRLNPDSPDARGVYEELIPFVDKLREKNRQVRDQIEQIRLEHEKQDAMRREFSANVSHELKTPLTAISGTAEILQNGLVRPEDVPHFAGNIRKEAGRLITLVNDIIELSRLDENSFPSVSEPVPLLPLANEIVSSLTLAAENKGITIKIKGDDASVCGQRSVLGEMLFNLCDNAIKYNRVDGEVNVQIIKTEDAVLLTVSDSGIGIPESELDRIFERFYRVDKSHSKEIGGTGLGLSIVKHGAKLHGADIEVQSTLGIGTAITLRFPEK